MGGQGKRAIAKLDWGARQGCGGVLSFWSVEVCWGFCWVIGFCDEELTLSTLNVQRALLVFYCVVWCCLFRSLLFRSSSRISVHLLSYLFLYTMFCSCMHSLRSLRLYKRACPTSRGRTTWTLITLSTSHNVLHAFWNHPYTYIITDFTRVRVWLIVVLLLCRNVDEHIHFHFVLHVLSVSLYRRLK